jgi:hypothetical protein
MVELTLEDDFKLLSDELGRIFLPTFLMNWLRLINLSSGKGRWSHLISFHYVHSSIKPRAPIVVTVVCASYSGTRSLFKHRRIKPTV